MEATELIQNWPGLAKANAARVLASPAWRLEAKYDGKPSVLTNAAGDAASLRAETPTVSLAITQDGAPGAVTFAPSPLFPDLWLLRERLAELPREVLLALVEKECGPLFQFFEDVGRQSFSVVGLAEAPSEGHAFRLATEGGEIEFSITVPPSVELQLGVLANLDATHEAIRSMTRDVTACYGVLEMSDGEIAALRTGDCLVSPEGTVATWALDLPSDGRVRLVAPETRSVTFAELADDTLGPVPEAKEVSVVRNGREIAKGEFVNLGEARVVKCNVVVL